MANLFLSTDYLLKEALLHLDNAQVMAKLVNRDYEAEFANSSGRGGKAGDTIRIRRPVRFTVRSGATYSAQDITEGRFAVTVATQEGVDMAIPSADLTLKIDRVAELYLKPAMIILANSIDRAIHSRLYKKTWNWVGTPGQTINSFADYALGPQRLDEMAVPTDQRNGVLSPSDYWGTLGSVSGLYISEKARTALERAKLGMFAGTDTYMSQNVAQHTNGARGGTPLIAGASQNTTYAATKDSGTQTLNIDGGSNSITGWAKEGDVFTIANVFAVNWVTKQTQAFLQQFVVRADANTDGAGATTLTISPPMITSGAYQTVNAAPADNAALTFVGSAATAYPQNLIFHPNAATLACVPLEMPVGNVEASQQSYKGMTMRLVRFYDGGTDENKYRFDTLFGTEALQPELAARVSGTA